LRVAGGLTNGHRRAVNHRSFTGSYQRLRAPRLDGEGSAQRFRRQNLGFREVLNEASCNDIDGRFRRRTAGRVRGGF
jgi:hypothetical protein